MRFLAVPVAILTVCVPAHAEIIFSNNFDAENGGIGASNFNSFTGLNVTGGTVDLVRSGTFGITCAGATGACVDLDGSSADAGSLISAITYQFEANDRVHFSFDISGNQRNTNVESWFAGINFNGLTSLSSVITKTYDKEFDSGPSELIQIAVSQNMTGKTPFDTKWIQFTAAQAGSFTFFIGGYGGDNMGAIVDNVLLTKEAVAAPIPTPGVPEPDAWAMMLIGFGLVGGSVRRRTITRHKAI